MGKYKYLLIAAVVVYFGIGFYIHGKKELERHKEKKTQEGMRNKEYIQNISKKYPDSFNGVGEIMNEIDKSIATQKRVELEKGAYRIEYYNSENKLVYYIYDSNMVRKNQTSNSRGIKSKHYTIKYPEEIGTVYDEKGRIKNRILLNYEKNNYYTVENENDRKSYFVDRMTGELAIENYKYNNDSYVVESIKLDTEFNSNYEKIEKEYKNNKMIKEHIFIDREGSIDDNKSLILVEITKEYDENEKLIKKFVLRKNKHNAVRSETNFDLIKGEIVTKYYDGEKAFATVTETLIGKDRAIVKRERVGDEFVIWDCYKYGKFNDMKDYILSKHNKYIVKNGEVTLKLENVQEWGTKYNDNQNGIEKINFFYEHIVSDGNNDYIGWIDNLENIIEYNNGKVFKSWKVNEQKNIRKQYRAYNFDLRKIEKDFEIVKNNIQENNIDKIIKKFREDI